MGTTVTLHGGITLDVENEARQVREGGFERGAMWLEVVGQRCAELEAQVRSLSGSLADVAHDRAAWREKAEARGKALEWLWDEGLALTERFDGKPGSVPFIIDQATYGPETERWLQRLAAATGVDPALLAPEEVTGDAGGDADGE